MTGTVMALEELRASVVLTGEKAHGLALSAVHSHAIEVLARVLTSDCGKAAVMAAMNDEHEALMALATRKPSEAK